MTPKMVRALADAEEAALYKGLARTRAGWSSTHPRANIANYHSFMTVNALLKGGYLDLWAKGKVAHITEGGRVALDTWRAKMAGAAA